MKGVKSAKVSFQAKQAEVEFDESRIPVSSLTQEMTATPHMMGKDMQYGGALLLKASGMKAARDADAVREALAKVKGVSKVKPDTRAQTVAVEFAPKGEVKTTDLIKAAKEAGYTLTLDKTAASREKGRGGGDSGGAGD